MLLNLIETIVKANIHHIMEHNFKTTHEKCISELDQKKLSLKNGCALSPMSPVTHPIFFTARLRNPEMGNT